MPPVRLRTSSAKARICLGSVQSGKRAGEIASVPHRDAYALRLVVGRTLYDHGRVVAFSPSLHHLAPEPAMLIAPAYAQRLGVTNGQAVKATSARASITVAVRAARGVAPRTAVLPFTADGTGAAELIDAADAVTYVRVETLR